MKSYVISELVNAEGLLVCPVCEKEFKPTDDTKYIVSGGYTCSWKCFLNEIKGVEAKKTKERKK